MLSLLIGFAKMSAVDFATVGLGVGSGFERGAVFSTNIDVETVVPPMLTDTNWPPMSRGTVKDIVRLPTESVVNTQSLISRLPMVNADKAALGGNPEAVRVTTAPASTAVGDRVNLGAGTIST